MQRIEAMKWLQRLALLVVVLWNALFGTPLRAQELTGPSAPKPVAWKGTAGDNAPANLRDLEKLAGELEAELAKLKLALEVDGATQDLRDKLTRLWVISTYREEFPRRWDVLVKIVLVRAEEMERRGELAAARAVATDLLPRPELVKELSRLHPSFEFVEAAPELIKGAEAARKDSRLVALRTRLETKLSQQKGLAYIGESAGNARNPAQDENAAALLEYSVSRALLEQQPGMIRDLGARAAVALERLVEADLEALPPDVTLDPLVLLFEVDEPRGAQFALEHWPKGGYLFHKRVLRAMERAKVLSNFGTWLAANPQREEQSFTPPKLVDTVWRDILVLAASDVEVRRDSLELLQILGDFDAFDVPLQQTLSGWIERGAASEAAAILNMLLTFDGRASVVPIAERALSNPAGEIRALAARLLEKYARNDALRARALDSEPEVRMAVARSFDGSILRTAYVIPSNARGMVVSTSMGGNSADFRRLIEARDSACIETLLADADPRVRELALKAFLQAPEVTVSTERLVELAKDADLKLRERLAKWGRAEAMPAHVVKELAADPNRLVSDEATQELQRISGERQRSNEPNLPRLQWSDEYLPAIEAAVVNPAIPSRGLQDASTRAGRSAEGARLLVRLARTLSTERAFWLLVAASSNQRQTFAWDAVGTEEFPVLMRETFLTEWRTRPENPSWRNNWIQLIGALPATHAAAFRSVLLDAKTPPEIRILAATASAATADAEWNRAFADVVEALPSDYWAGGTTELDMIRVRVENPTRKEALVQELARRRGSLQSLGHVIATICEKFDLPEPLALEVVERNDDGAGGGWTMVRRQALLSISFSEAEPRLQLVERLVMDRWLSLNVVQRVSQFHLEAHLPLFERIVMGEFGERGLEHAAAQALAGYLDDRAAEILLKAIAATSAPERRGVFFNALDEIRRYQDERERWANRKSSKAARDAAIAELVPMLADKDATIRAQAAKSLGALEALEQLPTLVRLLKDSNEGVRKAAQSAIDVLTAPKPASPGPEAPKSDAPAKKGQ